MPEIASGAGAGGLKIMGSIDTSMIERGFRRIRQSFDSVKGRAKSFIADQHRMITASKDLAKGLIRAGTVGAAMITALAKGAPAVAPAMAKIQVGLLKLKFAAGEALAPAFEKVSVWLDKLAVWADEHPDLFGGILISLSSIAALKFVGAMGLIKALGSFIVSSSGLIALGILAAGFAGYKAATFLIDKAQEWVDMGTDPDAPTDMSGQTLLTRFGQKTKSVVFGGPTPWEDITVPSPAQDRAFQERKAQGFQQTQIGMMSAMREEDRRFFLLAWWDAMWG